MKKLFFLILATLLFTISTSAQSFVMLRDNGPLRVEKDGVLIWNETVPAGTVLTLEDSNTVKKDFKHDKGITKGVDFYKVQYNDKTCYALASEGVALPPLQGLGAIKKDATIFEKKDASSFKNAILETGTLIVTDLDEFEESLNFRFVRAIFWDSSAWSIKTRYVQRKNVTIYNDDVKAVRFVERSNNFKDESMKKEFASKALDTAKSEQIKEYAQENYNKIFGIEEKIETEPYNLACEIFTADGDNVNVRDKPSLKSNVIGQCVSGARVFIDEKTVETFTIDNKTDSWYHIATPGENSIEGWVFGGYLNK